MLFNISEPCISRRILFWNGEMNKKITGGWGVKRQHSGQASVLFEEGLIKLSPSYKGGNVPALPAIAGTEDYINIDKISKIHAKVETVENSAAAVGIGTQSQSGTMAPLLTVAEAESIHAAGIVTVDVSGYTGEYIVFVMASPIQTTSSKQATISRVWWE